jgi:hypothetical protein
MAVWFMLPGLRWSGEATLGQRRVEIVCCYRPIEISYAARENALDPPHFEEPARTSQLPSAASATGHVFLIVIDLTEPAPRPAKDSVGA